MLGLSKALLLSFLLIGSQYTCAVGNSYGGKVAHVASVGDSILFTIVGGNQTTRPACASSLRFGVHKHSAHTPLILTAFATGVELGSVRGKGICTFWSTAEDIQWIEVCPIAGCP